MKKLSITLAVVATATFANAQQYMDISHAGIQPSAEITVAPGEDIEFIHGGGGPHPMTEGWGTGEASTPVPFETVTVTPTSPTAIFTLDTPGIYYFHCGTNPGNSSNWGKIIVSDSTSSVTNVEPAPLTISPNPATTTLTIAGPTEEVKVFDKSGKLVIQATSSELEISHLQPGTYFLSKGDQTSTFIKK